MFFPSCPSLTLKFFALRIELRGYLHSTTPTVIMIQVQALLLLQQNKNGFILHGTRYRKVHIWLLFIRSSFPSTTIQGKKKSEPSPIRSDNCKEQAAGVHGTSPAIPSANGQHNDLIIYYVLGASSSVSSSPTPQTPSQVGDTEIKLTHPPSQLSLRFSTFVKAQFF